jgi:hypothetical protein
MSLTSWTTGILVIGAGVVMLLGFVVVLVVLRATRGRGPGDEEE